MNVFNFFRGADINSGFARYKDTDGAVLLDIRSAEEFKKKHIPGSINVPAEDIQKIESIVIDKEIPVFIYGDGRRKPGRELYILKVFGYTNVTYIGGIQNFNGLTAM